MWKPPERIKFKASEEAWPDARQAQQSTLFSPLNKGRLSLKQRTWIPAMVPWRATDEGEVTEHVLDWYQRFAEGKPGAIVVEATGIRDVPSGPLLRIGHDRFIPGLKKLVETVREASNGETRLFIQLIDFLSIRRRPKKERFLQQFLQITDELRKALADVAEHDEAIRDHLCTLDDEALQNLLNVRDFESLTRGFRERVTDTQQPHIAELPQTLPTLFADAAVRAQTAGFDGVELHYAHAYTMASFLSAVNTREDGYGGPRESRIKLPLEVFRSVRAALDDATVCGCRILTDDCIEGGSRVDDAAYFASELAKAGMDFVSLSRGGKFEDAKKPSVGQAIYPYTGPSGYECMPAYLSDSQGPFGRNVPASQQLAKTFRRQDIETPLVVAGGIHSFTQAEQILQDGSADIIGLARQALADPDWFTKVSSGHGNAVNLCEYTNYCEGLDSKHKMVTCQLWDRIDRGEPGSRLTPDGKRRTTAPPWRKEQEPNQ
ncbi:MAG: NADH:flavin oxidoreductase [Lysobacterales bacterium]